MGAASDYTRRLAELAVRVGANVQPGQILVVASEPGMEPLARAVAEVAYEQGAKFVDLSVFDPYVKRARALHADPATLDYVPPWLGAHIRALGEHRAASIAFTGPATPHLMDDVEPELLGRDMLPWVTEINDVIQARLLNWNGVPCPSEGWATLVHPDLPPNEALELLWREIAHVCRLDEPDPAMAWRTRLDRLREVASKLDALRLDSLRFAGPGTDLTVGLFNSSPWLNARLTTAGGIEHVANIPTEEVFTAPDPERVNGLVTSTKPLFTSGALITGLKVRFEDGRAVEIDAERGAETLRALSQHDPGAARLGEVALVDRDSRIGGLGVVFYDTLLDENAASHIALGQGVAFEMEDPDDLERMNSSGIHIDFMIGGDDVEVTGVTRDGDNVPLLRRGVWQL
jgi:aminopeptidase